MYPKPWKVLLAAGVALTACAHEQLQDDRSAPANSAEYRQSIEQWRARRLARLKAKGGWLSLAGLYWLRPGRNSVGSGADMDIRLADRAPARLGVLEVQGDRVLFKVEAGVPARHQGKPVRELELVSDAGGRRRPDTIEVGDFTLLIIERGGKLALRVFDDRSPTRLDFRGLEYYPLDERYRVMARLVPYPQPRKVPFKTVIATTVEASIPGELHFKLLGKECSLLPIAEPGGSLFIVFADRTNGRGSYGGGRFLEAEWSGRADQAVELDFNKAYNPPCAFSPYATCPVPRPENRLPLEVRAGEKFHGHSGTEHER